MLVGSFQWFEKRAVPDNRFYRRQPCIIVVDLPEYMKPPAYSFQESRLERRIIHQVYGPPNSNDPIEKPALEEPFNLGVRFYL